MSVINSSIRLGSTEPCRGAYVDFALGEADLLLADRLITYSSRVLSSSVATKWKAESDLLYAPEYRLGDSEDLFSPATIDNGHTQDGQVSFEVHPSNMGCGSFEDLTVPACDGTSITTVASLFRLSYSSFPHPQHLVVSKWSEPSWTSSSHPLVFRNVRSSEELVKASCISNQGSTFSSSFIHVLPFHS